MSYKPLLPEKFEFVNILLVLKNRDDLILQCGNRGCTGIVRFKKKQDERPKRCSICGSEINWTDLIMKENVCPQCNRKYDVFEKFCSFCPTKTSLNTVTLD